MTKLLKECKKYHFLAHFAILGQKVAFLEILFWPVLKRISVRYSGDAYSFQCGMQSLIWGECNIITLVRNAVANMG